MAGVLAGVFALTMWFLITGIGVGRDLQGLRASTNKIQTAIASGEYATAGMLLEEAAAQSASLDSGLTSAPWSWAQSFPVVGQSLVAGAVLASAADDVLANAAGVGTGLSAVAAGADVATIAAALKDASPSLATTADSAAAAVENVSAMDTSGVLGPLRGRMEQARAQMLRVAEPLAQGATLARVVPGMLGVDGPTRWLVILSQPAEARGSAGGFFGAYLPVEVAQGRFAPGESKPNNRVAYVRQDLSGLPDEYEWLWGPDAAYLYAYNMTRHYPYAASVASRALDPSANYVVSLAPRAVAGLMALSGPITVDGVTLDASSAEMFFSHDIYVRYEPGEKDAVTAQFLQQLFIQLSSVQLDPVTLWRGLAPAVAAGQVQVWSPDRDVSDALAASPLGGAVPATSGPWVTAAFNNNAGNKIDSYVRSKLHYEATGSCEAGVVEGSVTATLELEKAPAGLPAYVVGRNDDTEMPYATSAMLVHLYGPSGALGKSFEVNGVAVPANQGFERGHPVWSIRVQLAPGAPVKVKATFDQAAFAGQRLKAVPQPMVHDTSVSVIDDRSCGLPTSG